MESKELHKCTREREIDRLILDCTHIDQNQGKLEIMIQKMSDKLDGVDKKVDEIKSDNLSFENRLTKLEKFIYGLKWFFYGAVIVSLAHVFGIWTVLAGLLGVN